LNASGVHARPDGADHALRPQLGQCGVTVAQCGLEVFLGAVQRQHVDAVDTHAGEGVLDAAPDTVAGEVPDPPMGPGTWKESSIRSAGSCGSSSRPTLVDSTYSLRGAWRRNLPIRYPERIVDAAVRAGLSTEEAVDAYRIIWHYTAALVNGLLP
jgi:hypothetical protein